MPQNRERLPSEPLRAIGSRVLSRESHNTRSMNSNGWGASSRDDPLHVSQEAESAQAVGRVDPVATSDPVFLHKTRVESLCCGLRCHRIRKLLGDKPDDDDVPEFQLSDTA
jgi:hypothetical protein